MSNLDSITSHAILATMDLHLDAGLEASAAKRAATTFLKHGSCYIALWGRVVNAGGPVRVTQTGELEASVVTIPACPILRAEAMGLRLLIQRLWITCLLDEVQLEAKAKTTLDAMGILDPARMAMN